MYSDYGIPRELSNLQKLRSLYKPEFPPCLQGTAVRVEFGDVAIAADPSGAHTISRSFPHTYGHPIAHFLRATAKVPDAQIITELPAVRVGVVFCGRQSPGGHNVIWDLFDVIKVHNPKRTLLGFLGGYDLLGRTKDQIRTTEQVNAALNTCIPLNLDALVIIGGVTSNTYAAQMAETFAERKYPTKVVGIPVTLSGDLKNQFVETNVGFDTICKKSYFIIAMDYSITSAMMSLLLISIWVAPGHFLLVGVWELHCYQSQRPFTIGAAVAAVLEAEPAVGVGKLLGEQRGYAGCLMGRLLGKGACSW